MIQLIKRLGAQRCLAAGNLGIALVIGLGAFRLLPVRSPWLGVPAAIAIALLVAASVALALRARWADAITRLAGLALFWGGLLGVGALLLGLTFSRAVTATAAGPGPLMFVFAILLALPYTVFYGLGLLLWVAGRTVSVEANGSSAAAPEPAR
jgi:hypothetical protein